MSATPVGEIKEKWILAMLSPSRIPQAGNRLGDTDAKLHFMRIGIIAPSPFLPVVRNVKEHNPAGGVKR